MANTLRSAILMASTFVLAGPAASASDPLTADEMRAILKPLQDEVAELRKTVEAMQERDLRTSDWVSAYRETKTMPGPTFAQIYCGNTFPGSIAIDMQLIPIPTSNVSRDVPIDADSLVTFRCRKKP